MGDRMIKPVMLLYFQLAYSPTIESHKHGIGRYCTAPQAPYSDYMCWKKSNVFS